MGAGDLAGQRHVEEPAVVKAGERVEVGQLARLAEPARVLDRRACVCGERLQLADVVLAELPSGLPREDRQVADRPVFPGHRNGEPGVDDRVLTRLSLELRIGVGHRDRAREPAVGRAGDRMPLGLFDREPERREERLSVGRIGEEHEGRIRAAERACRLERSRQHLVEVDRARELAEDPASAAFLLGSLERALELAAQLVHPAVQAGDDLGDPLVRRRDPSPARDEQAEQEEHKSSQAGRDADQDGRHGLKGPQILPAISL